jgi:hypothetical protein
LQNNDADGDGLDDAMMLDIPNGNGTPGILIKWRTCASQPFYSCNTKDFIAGLPDTVDL